MDLKKLMEPFAPEDVEWFIGVTTKDKSKGLAIPFITNRAVMDRLDEVCGVDGWQNEYKPLKQEDVVKADGVIEKKTSHLCGISIWSEKRNEWITKWDGAEESDIEALKGGLSSAMKRAAVQFGIGRYLYKLESPWVEIEPQGRSYRIKPNQKLIMPDWALPGGRGYPVGAESRQVTVQAGGAAPQAPAQAPANAQQQNSNSTANKQLSDKQIARAMAKAAAAGKGADDIKAWIQKKYQLEGIEQLNRQQYDALCAAMDKAKIQN